MTFDEFLESEALRQSIGEKKWPTYQLKFRRIIEQAGIGNQSLEALDDPKVLGKLRKTRGWNWASFLFNSYWYGFRKGDRWMEVTALFTVMVSLAGYLILLLDGSANANAPGNMGLAIALMLGYGFYGDANLMIAHAKAIRNGEPMEKSTSGFNIVIVLLITLGLIIGLDFTVAPMLGIEQPL